MYKLEFLPLARQDMVDIVRYISCDLQNREAAERLSLKLMKAADNILLFPYANPVYTPIRPLKHEYRKLLIDNYMMFYCVNEYTKMVTVVRVIYAGRDLGTLL